MNTKLFLNRLCRRLDITRQAIVSVMLVAVLLFALAMPVAAVTEMIPATGAETTAQASDGTAVGGAADQQKKIILKPGANLSPEQLKLWAASEVVHDFRVEATIAITSFLTEALSEEEADEENKPSVEVEVLDLELLEGQTENREIQLERKDDDFKLTVKDLGTLEALTLLAIGDRRLTIDEEDSHWIEVEKMMSTVTFSYKQLALIVCQDGYVQSQATSLTAKPEEIETSDEYGDDEYDDGEYSDDEGVEQSDENPNLIVLEYTGYDSTIYMALMDAYKLSLPGFDPAKDVTLTVRAVVDTEVGVLVSLFASVKGENNNGRAMIDVTTDFLEINTLEAFDVPEVEDERNDG